MTAKSKGPAKPTISSRQLRRSVGKSVPNPALVNKVMNDIGPAEWGWVGTQVDSAAEIGPEHRAAACGFRKHICKNKQAPIKAPTPSAQPRKVDDDNDVLVISDDEPECSAKACKSNPNCCNYLGQEKWRSEASARKLFLEAAGIGPDPQEEARTSGHPVGLKNLGATCYANSIIQVWFQDLEFRAGVYKSLPELSLPPGKTIEESPMYQLQTTFGMLQESTRKSFNPIKFVECLGIRTAEQQDAQEFSKLFISHLDNEFKKQQDVPLQSLITDQFEGKQVYGTRCTRCNNSSEHPSTFLELEISLTAECKLEERLVASLEEEKLEGDNQYDCSTCGSKQDAFRYQRITHLPPVLHFSVLRFIFDPKDMERKKSKQAINYPLEIDMRPYVSGGQSDLRYDLRGVLLHRGASAYHGHYEAQVYDVTRKKWFLFNDEEVKEIKKEDVLGRQIGNFRANGSKDAYMLIYGQRDKLFVDTEYLTLPEHVFRAVGVLNEEYTNECNHYLQMQQSLQEEFAAIRNLKQEIYQSWHILNIDEVSVVLSREDLENWIAEGLQKGKDKKFIRSPTVGNEPLPPKEEPSLFRPAEHTLESPSPPSFNQIFNGQESTSSNGLHPPKTNGLQSLSSITCPHGLLDPEKSTSMKRIRKSTWERMKQSGMEIMGLESGRVCETCTATQFNEKLYALQHADSLSRFEFGMQEDKSREWWISKSWLKDWKLKRPKMHKPGHRDPIPNTGQFEPDIYCEHKGKRLVQAQKSKDKISTAALRVLQEVFPEFQPPSINTDACQVCQAVAETDREANREIRIKSEAERSRLSVLARASLSDLENPISTLTEGPDYAIVPLPWLNRWRIWVSKPLANPRPDLVPNEEFVCAHDKLLIDPTEPLDVNGVVCFISHIEWNTIQELYGGGPFLSFSVEEASNGKFEMYAYNREVCKDCRTLRLSNLDNVSINVYRLAKDESLPWMPKPPVTPTKTHAKTKDTSDVINIDDSDVESPTLSDASPPARAPGQKKRTKPTVTYGLRKSKRLRTAAEAKKGTTFSISVSKDDTLRDIKNKIQLVEDVHPYYQKLYLNEVELEDDEKTVSQIGLLRTDRLILQAIEAMDEDDAVAWALASGDVKPKDTRPRVEGRAFGGTLLDGSMHGLQASNVPPEVQALVDVPGSSMRDDDYPMASASSGPVTPTIARKASLTPGPHELSTTLEDARMEDNSEEITTFSCPRCTFINKIGSGCCEICDLSFSQ